MSLLAPVIVPDASCLIDMQGKKDLVAVDNNEDGDEAGEAGSSDNEGSDDKAQDGTSSDVDSDEERRRYSRSLR